MRIIKCYFFERKSIIFFCLLSGSVHNLFGIMLVSNRCLVQFEP